MRDVQQEEAGAGDRIAFRWDHDVLQVKGFQRRLSYPHHTMWEMGTRLLDDRRFLGVFVLYLEVLELGAEFGSVGVAVRSHVDQAERAMVRTTSTTMVPMNAPTMIS